MKKNFGKLSAAALAAMTAVSAMSIVAYAADGDIAQSTVNSSYVSGNVYSYTVTTNDPITTLPTTTTKYFTSEAYATAGKSKETGTVSAISSTSVNSWGNVWIKNDGTGEVVKSNPNDTTNYVSYKTTSTPNNPTGSSTSTSTSNYTTPYSSISSNNWQDTSGYAYKGDKDSYWYPNMTSLYAAGNNYSTGTKSVDRSYGAYFNYLSGTYETTSGAYNVYISNAYNGYNSYYYNNGEWRTVSIYKVDGGSYYLTRDEAVAAAGGDSSKVSASHSTRASYYFSKDTGYFYPTYQSALDASTSTHSNAVVPTSSSYYNYYYNSAYGYYDSYGVWHWYNDSPYYYYGYYDYYYNDPYYYYFLNKNSSSSSSSSSSKKDTTTATVGNKKGWTNVASYLKTARSNSTVTVDMNTETTIPSDVLSAIKGKNISVKFVLDNGVSFTINGKNVTSAKDIDVTTRYNTNRIPSSLVRAAYNKNKAVGTAQISVNSGSFGTSANLTVKLSSGRAGYRAKLYRYDNINKTLKLVATSTIQNDGKCTFNTVTAGGDFVIAIF